MPPPKYTEAQLARIEALWLQDNPQLSTARIAAELAAEPEFAGMTKNALIGLAGRQGWKARPSPIRPSADGSPPRPRRPKPPPRWGHLPHTARAVVDLKALPEDPPAPVVEATARRIERRCEWPIGDHRKPGFRWCDEPAVRERPWYCDQHQRAAFARFHRKEEPEAA